jgi:outer membrane biosynthesis protein TonB
MSTAVASLRRLLTASRAPRSGNVQIPAILASRGFCHRAALAKPVLVSPIAAARLADALSRGYATTTTTKPKRKTTTTKKTTKTKKKTTAKKAVKKPKKKVVKKPKKKVAKKPVQLRKPKLMKLPPNSAISGYQLFMKETLLSTSGPGVPGRFTAAAAQWKALSDAEKQVYRHSPFRLASLHVLRRC